MLTVPRDRIAPSETFPFFHMEAKGPGHAYAYLRVIHGVHDHLSDWFRGAAAVCGDSDLLRYAEACLGTGTKLPW